MPGGNNANSRYSGGARSHTARRGSARHPGTRQRRTMTAEDNTVASTYCNLAQTWHLLQNGKYCGGVATAEAVDEFVGAITRSIPINQGELLMQATIRDITKAAANPVSLLCSMRRPAYILWLAPENIMRALKISDRARLVISDNGDVRILKRTDAVTASGAVTATGAGAATGAATGVGKPPKYARPRPSKSGASLGKSGTSRARPDNPGGIDAQAIARGVEAVANDLYSSACTNAAPAAAVLTGAAPSAAEPADAVSSLDPPVVTVPAAIVCGAAPVTTNIHNAAIMVDDLGNLGVATHPITLLPRS
jgi:hypothetical protein